MNGDSGSPVAPAAAPPAPLYDSETDDEPMLATPRAEDMTAEWLAACPPRHRYSRKSMIMALERVWEYEQQTRAGMIKDGIPWQKSRATAAQAAKIVAAQNAASRERSRARRQFIAAHPGEPIPHDIAKRSGGSGIARPMRVAAYYWRNSGYP